MGRSQAAIRNMTDSRLRKRLRVGAVALLRPVRKNRVDDFACSRRIEGPVIAGTRHHDDL